MELEMLSGVCEGKEEQRNVYGYGLLKLKLNNLGKIHMDTHYFSSFLTHTHNFLVPQDLKQISQCHVQIISFPVIVYWSLRYTQTFQVLAVVDDEPPRLDSKITAAEYATDLS